MDDTVMEMRKKRAELLMWKELAWCLHVCVFVCEMVEKCGLLLHQACTVFRRPCVCVCRFLYDTQACVFGVTGTRLMRL